MSTLSSRSAAPAAYRRMLLSTLLATAAAALVACQPAVAPAAQGAPAVPPPPLVEVAAVEQRAVEPHTAQVGRVEAAQRVEVRPRVSGHVEAVLFREGDRVKPGQPLFRIDPRLFDVALQRAQADLQLARAKEALARSEAERAQHLVRERALSQEELERRGAAQAEAAARTDAAQAALQAARLDRDFAIVTAPVAGRIGRALVTAGNYVAAGGSQPLATLSATAPLHVHFDVGDPVLVGQLAAARTPGAWQARVLDPRTGAALATAPVDFVDHEMAGNTGTLRLRARIDRPAASLLPGQFVRVQLAGATRDSLLVPDKAIGFDQGQRFVLVLGPGGQAEYRAVQVGALHGEQRVIASGLEAGERVIASGLTKVRPGMKVQPQGPAPDMPPTQAAAPAHRS